MKILIFQGLNTQIITLNFINIYLFIYIYIYINQNLVIRAVHFSFPVVLRIYVDN